jgi:hypothetical protein
MLAGVSGFALLAATAAHAGSILKQQGGTPAPSTAASQAATTASQQAADAVARSNSILSRTGDILKNLRDAQAAARANAGLTPNPAGAADGLNPGGLVAAPGAAPGSTLWQGVDLPTETVTGAKHDVTIKQNQQKAILPDVGDLQRRARYDADIRPDQSADRRGGFNLDGAQPRA